MGNCLAIHAAFSSDQRLAYCQKTFVTNCEFTIKKICNVAKEMKPPMLAASDLPTQSHLELSCSNAGFLIVQPKYDGIRALNGRDGLFSRSLKPIPNQFITNQIRQQIGHFAADGEIVVYENEERMDFNTTQSYVMSQNKPCSFIYHVFDTWDSRSDFRGRYGELANKCPFLPHLIEQVENQWCFDIDQLNIAHQHNIDMEHEGSIVRSPHSPYKHGRTTLREAFAMKIKPFADEEAQIVGGVALEINENPQFTNALGLQERRKGIACMVPQKMLGAFVCHSIKWGMFRVGTGLTDLQRCNFWESLQTLMDQHAQLTFRYQPNHSRDKPHAASFKAIRIPE